MKCLRVEVYRGLKEHEAKQQRGQPEHVVAVTNFRQSLEVLVYQEVHGKQVGYNKLRVKK